MAARKSTPAELGLVQLRNCFVNLPLVLSNLLLDANVVVQNVVVELQYQGDERHGQQSRTSIFLGWTGMSSQRRNPGSTKERTVVEIDAAFARTLGLTDRQNVQILLHLDPPTAHTIHVEPLTAADWEIIELHAAFLETNLLAQIRAVPNPITGPKVHPLTVHLSPTSTANILVSSLEPVPLADVSFVKISPDAEIVVAPKTRATPSRQARNDTGSVTSGSRKSATSRSATGSAKHRNKPATIKAFFLRSVVVSDPSLSTGREGLDSILLKVDEQLLMGGLKDIEYVSVMVVLPSMVQSSENAREETVKQASKVIAKLAAWEEAPDSQHGLVSLSLSAGTGGKIETGSIIRIQPATNPLANRVIKSLKISPFPAPGSATNNVLKFGGETRASRQAAAEHLKSIYKDNILDGPLTDGMCLSPVHTSRATGWHGGVLHFEYSSTIPDDEKFTRWTDGRDQTFDIQVQQEINPPSLTKASLDPQSKLVGVDSILSDLVSILLHGSSVLLCGGIGSGKTAIASQIAQTLKEQYFFSTLYQSCRKLLADDIRLTTIKETLEKTFTLASWGATLGGKSLVILDDLDKLCPAEQELQVGNDNARARQISEILCSLIHRTCRPGSRVLVLITAQGKSSLHDTIVGGHVVRETKELKAPNKDSRRRILEALVTEPQEIQQQKGDGDTRNGVHHPNGWLHGSDSEEHTTDSERSPIQTSPNRSNPRIDYLDIANLTDGYLAGDLKLLISRAQSQAVARLIHDTTMTSIILKQEDFTKAIEGFIPASLRNVTLQTSSTKFDSVGGLKDARKMLIETLQYPTAYAPIFDRCPLRLRSGLLLYGYPGCGKTLLASAVAGECGLNFISVKGPEILNKYIGASEKSIRDLFERAEAAKPCILFFDEFDSIAPKRGHDSTGVTDRVVNQLLTQMDGAEGLSGVYVLAATSRPDLIDPALLRPGRLDKSLICDMPSEDDRLDILRAVAKDLHVNSSVIRGSKSLHSLEEVARRTEGYTGADLQAVMYNSHLEAIHDALDDRKGNATDAKSGRTGINSVKNLAPAKEYLHLQYGTENMKSDGNDSKSRARMNDLRNRLEAAKLGRKKEKERRHNEQDPRRISHKDQKVETEVIIQWKHIEASLKNTRSSMNVDERRKLERIYKEFLSARDGEMLSGQGPTEVGARSSLM